MSDRIEFYLPQFPSNMFGLQRGSILMAARDIPQLGMKKGDLLPVGFDGKYVRCLGFTWSIDKLQDEILDGIWEVTKEIIDLSDSERMRSFIQEVEQREATALS